MNESLSVSEVLDYVINKAHDPNANPHRLIMLLAGAIDDVLRKQQDKSELCSCCKSPD